MLSNPDAKFEEMTEMISWMHTLIDEISELEVVSQMLLVYLFRYKID